MKRMILLLVLAVIEERAYRLAREAYSQDQSSITKRGMLNTVDRFLEVAEAFESRIGEPK